MARSTRIGVAGTALAHFTLNTAHAIALDPTIASPSGHARAHPSQTRRRRHARLGATAVTESPEGRIVISILPLQMIRMSPASGSSVLFSDLATGGLTLISDRILRDQRGTYAPL